MIEPLPLVQDRQLPGVYQDDGCDLHSRCLTCPFVICRYDMPGGKKALMNINRNQLIGSLRQSGKTVPIVAKLMDISRRTVVRVASRGA